MKRKIFKILYGIEFEPGYTYRKIKSTPIPICNYEPSFKLFERMINYWISEGWEQYGDIKAGWSHLYLWIRKKNN